MYLDGFGKCEMSRLHSRRCRQRSCTPLELRDPEESVRLRTPFHQMNTSASGETQRDFPGLVVAACRFRIMSAAGWASRIRLGHSRILVTTHIIRESAYVARTKVARIHSTGRAARVHCTEQFQHWGCALSYGDAAAGLYGFNALASAIVGRDQLNRSCVYTRERFFKEQP